MWFPFDFAILVQVKMWPSLGQIRDIRVFLLYKIPDQNSGMSEYEYIPDPRKMSNGLTSKPRLFDESRAFFLGISVGY